jgi:hypothetical protein
MVTIDSNKGYIGINQYNGKIVRRKVGNMTNGTRLPAIVMTVLMISTMFLAFVPYTAAQSIHLKPTLTISTMNPQSREVVVTPSSIGSASFSATVTVSKPPAVGTVMVTLDGSTSTGWPTVVSPQSIPFTTPNSIQFTITVVVPQATPTSSIGKVIVSGLATYPGGSVAGTSSATVTVVQYFRIQPQAQLSFVTISPGGQAVMALDLYNRGNGLDSIVIDITNIKDLSKKNWMVAATAYEVSNIPQDEYGTIKISVKSPKPMYGIDYKRAEITYIQLTVKSGNAEIAQQVVTKSYMFAVVVDGWGIPGFDVTFLIIAFGMVAAGLAYRKRSKF